MATTSATRIKPDTIDETMPVTADPGYSARSPAMEDCPDWVMVEEAMTAKEHADPMSTQPESAHCAEGCSETDGAALDGSGVGP
jgi:hypothetical protein